MPVDFITVKPNRVQVVSKRTDLTDRCLIIRINDSFKERQGFIELIRSSGSGHTMAVYTKRRFQLRVFLNGLNTYVVNPVLKEIVFIGKAVAGIKSKIINHDPERIINKTDASFVGDTVIFAINMKLMKVIITPALHDLENEVKRSQRRISSDS
ncbi:hypothetical protein BIY27_19945 [Gibbsiella quercinecans]|nr:hypothetical protein BIY27_19945 [Gibbsiella quercinecans]